MADSIKTSIEILSKASTFNRLG